MILVLRTLRTGDEVQALAGHRAMAGERFPFLLGYRPPEPFAAFVERLERQREGRDLPAGWVPCTYFVAEVAGVIVGRVSLRHELTPLLRLVSGHIGFCVLPEHRRRGYASAMLRQALTQARELGHARVLVMCDEPNLGSRRVIERCGGAYEDTYRGEDAPQGIRRYWIDTGHSPRPAPGD